MLDALGYDPAGDTVHDLFNGSGAVTAAADGMLVGVTTGSGDPS